MKTLLKTLGFLFLLNFVFIPLQTVTAQDDQSPYTGMNTADNPTGTTTAANNTGPAVSNDGANDTPTGPMVSPNGNAANKVTFQTFYDQLSSLGTWIQTSQYGYVFQPKVNDPNWRPYTYGHWVDTDEGMMWNSDEPFGWATYHYGRWVNLTDDGWVWVPGYTWAPAWVSWRQSDEDYAWAPLPPESEMGVDLSDSDEDDGLFGFYIGDDCDQVYDIGPWCYNFCPVAYIGDPYPWRHFRDHRENFARIGHTHNITRISAANNARPGHFGRVDSGGPALAGMNAHSSIPVRHASLTSAATLTENGHVQGNSLAVFAPQVDPNSVKTARPHSIDRTLAETRVNHGANINQPPAVTANLRSASATPEQIHAATRAQGSALPGAKIATADTHPSHPLNQPLTSFHVNNTAAIQTPAHPAPIHSPAGAGEEAAHQPMGNSFHPAANAPANGFSPNNSPVFHSATQPAFNANNPSPVFHASSAPVFHPAASAPVFHPQPSFHAAAPAPVFHSQPSFHAAGPAMHLGGGGAPHLGGGNPGGGGGGGHFGGGGGGGGHHR